MGGLAGIACRDAKRRPDDPSIRAMGGALAHRGCGADGHQVAAGIGLAGSRMAILDPSPPGSPRGAGEDGQVRLALDGAIYNHVELREELKRRGLEARARSDAEVVLQLYLGDGLDVLHRLIGMFALAVWDGRRRSLLLARDRLGVKPLLYRLADDGLRFASEAAGLLAEPGFEPEPDPEAIHSLLSLRFVPRPGTAYAGIRVLPPAHLLVYEQGHVRLQRYWSIPDPPVARPARPGELEERHRALLDEAVRVRLRGEAPPALCLSGGLDSAAIAYHMRRNLTRSFRAFSVAFEGEDKGERVAARQAAARFGIDLLEIEAAPLRTLDELQAIVGHMQAPLADPALLRAWIVAREVSRHARVALVGDGGDEIFGGYDRYRAHLLADRFGWLPGLLWRTPLRALLEAISTEGSRRDLPGRLRRFLEGWELPARDRHVHWMANPGARRIARLYRPEFAARVAGADPTRGLGSIPNDWASPGLIASILRADLEHVLPDDLLFRADAASMAFGLELRSPFLDHRVVEFAAGVPADQKVRLRPSRRFLRRVYRGRLPERILRRHRGGFGPPVGRWFGGDLQQAARDLLLDPSARSHEYLNRDAVAAVLRIDRTGQRNYDALIWTLLILELWLRRLPRHPGARVAA